MGGMLELLFILFEELEAIVGYFFDGVIVYYQDFETIGKMIFIIFILFLLLFVCYVVIILLRLSFVKDLSKLQNVRTEYQIILNRADEIKCNFFYEVLLFQKMVILDDEIVPKHMLRNQVLISSQSIPEITPKAELKEQEFVMNYDKLKQRMILSSVFIVIIFITMFFTKYNDFDIIFESIYNLKYQEYIIMNNIGSLLFVFGFVLSVLMTIFLWFYYYLDGEWKSNLNKKTIYNTFDVLSIIPVFIAVFTIINAFVISPAGVTKKSMEPTYYEGNTVFILHSNRYNRFDVVIVLADEGTTVPESEFSTRNEYHIKRIIGLPGETITIRNGKVYVNGIVLDESRYLAENINSYCGVGAYRDGSEECTFMVGEGEYFLLGDNRVNSLDSRNKGNYTFETLYGKAFFKIG